MQEEIPKENLKATNRFTLVLLAMAFIVPLMVAYVAFLNMDSTGRTKNRGDLIVPARPIEHFSLKRVDGTAYTLEHLKGKWTLIYVGGTKCEQACEQALYKIRQSRLAQNEEIPRVQRLMIVVGEEPAASLKRILTEHKGMDVIVGKSDAVNKLLGPFELDGRPAALEANRVYISDPLGNLMMSYPDKFDPRGLIKDLQHLLKVSQIG